ncbi:HupE/UreJ family protein [Methylomonas sp. SURF-2]|uniref:HupE/UreJ family protein n=1 Tax=Methylomonas subterranea TaxID=2952225 RepID=A0ABT1TGC1_9GAMM|nr:HupE/UreJ family protein [Methylomonas sp. SURF-2]MCQ8104364.1 HupE/UreJ family protein [Methylomonas sp. SURF-2]
MGFIGTAYGRVLLAALLLLATASVWAHAPGLSSLDVLVNPDRLDVKVTFALQDIEAFSPMDSDLDAEVTDGEREAAKPAIARLLAGQLRISLDGADIAPAGPGLVEFDGQNNARAEFHYPVAAKQQLSVQSGLLMQLPEGHQQYLTVRDASGKALAEKMLTRQDDRLGLSLGDPASGEARASASALFNTFSDFFKLGIEHIVTGYDHLLFLLALLVVTHSFWPAVKIITFFTLAHSLTLALAGLNLVELPSSFVEPFIAATIIYVGIENLIRGEHPKGRHWLTFGFGLIHGFGFAGVLKEMDISSGDTGILLPLLSFNLGIESGQIAVASLVLPLIWWLNNNVRIADRFLRGCSIAVSLMGCYWLVERTVF